MTTGTSGRQSEIGIQPLSRTLHRGEQLGENTVERCDAYRHFAAQCVELARHTDTAYDRSVLLEMALLWSRLAEIAAKAAMAPGSVEPASLVVDQP